MPQQPTNERQPGPERAIAIGLAAVLLSGPALLLMLKLIPALDAPMLHSPFSHVLISGAASFLGALLALLVLRVAIRARDARVFFVGMGFLGTASIFFIHAIATPGAVMDGRGLATQWSGLLSLIVGGLFFAVSSLRLTMAQSQVVINRASNMLAAYLLCWTLYAGTVLFWPPLIAASVTATAYAATREVAGSRTEAHAHTINSETSTAPATSNTGGVLDLATDLTTTLALPLTLVGLLSYIFAAANHFQFYRTNPTNAGLAITCGIILLGEALLTQRLAGVYNRSFWLYHVQEFTGFAVISYAVLVAYRRGLGIGGFFEGLFLGGTRARIRAEYTQAMDALIATLSRSEQPTPGLRKLLRERLDLSETQVQVLEHAATAVAQERRQRQELEQLNAELIKLQEDRDQLSQMIVHDLKNPLTAMIGFLEILRMHSPNDTERPLVESALRSGKNLTGLIEDLLDLGKMQQGHLELSHDHVQPHALLAECAAQMQGWGAQEEKPLYIEVATNMPALDGDERLLRRVLLNLVSNAIKHTPPGTTITLGAREVVGKDGMPAIELTVSDTGTGIPPELLPYIFDKYRRGAAQPTGRQSSTGLGLTFCRMATEAHGGTISVSSTVGQGTTFTVCLPIAPLAELVPA